jgi:hypothetical protein
LLRLVLIIEESARQLDELRELVGAEGGGDGLELRSPVAGVFAGGSARGHLLRAERVAIATPPREQRPPAPFKGDAIGKHLAPREKTMPDAPPSDEKARLTEERSAFGHAVKAISISLGVDES